MRDLIIMELSRLGLDPEKFVAWKVMLNGGTIFEALVATVLTQNTSDINAGRAFEALKRRIKISPSEVLSLGEEELAEVIRPAGMYMRRARQLIELARAILERYGNDLEFIRNMSVEESRQLLMSLPGIGPKTADVILVNLGKPAFPVDTHILRISKRIGLASTYDSASKAWMRIFQPNEYLWGHLSLIEFGRRICRARNPKCNQCGLQSICKYYKDQRNR
ncbi:MAG: endonuclease III domain-containing protein [Thermocladium sp.]